MRITKFALVALASASMIAASGAQAGSVSATVGMSLAVSDSCSIIGHTMATGIYSTSSTFQDYIGREGSSNAGTNTPGTEVARPIASISCTNGSQWTLTLPRFPVSAPGGSTAFTVVGYAANVDGTNITTPHLLDAGLTMMSLGSTQTVEGYYLMDETVNNFSPNTSFGAGNYSGSATATVMF